MATKTEYRNDVGAGTRTNRVEDAEHEYHEDPITGEPGAHPVGAGLGAAMGGAAAGLGAGAVAGPIGAAVGAVAGGVVGGLAGKEIAEQIDPTAEDAYWRNEYRHRDYYDEAVPYDDIQPAYRHGWESRGRYGNRSWREAESAVHQDWEKSEQHKSMSWDKAKSPVRDAWERVDVRGLMDSARQRDHCNDEDCGCG
jgi:hypothetical protein